MVSRGRVISRFGGRVVRLGLGVDRGAFVFDISNITVVVISGVGHSLDTAIGKSNLVRSRNGFAVSGLLSVEFGSRVFIGDTVCESIRLRGLIVVRSWGIGGDRGVVGSWGSSGKSGGNSHDGGEDGKGIHNKYVRLSVHKIELMLTTDCSFGFIVVNLLRHHSRFCVALRALSSVLCITHF